MTKQWRVKNPKTGWFGFQENITKYTRWGPKENTSKYKFGDQLDPCWKIHGTSLFEISDTKDEQKVKIDILVQMDILVKIDVQSLRCFSYHTCISDISGVNSARLTASDGDLLKPMDFDLFTGWLVKYTVYILYIVDLLDITYGYIRYM